MTVEIFYEVCPQAEEWELLRELSYLEVREEVLWRPFSTLSNGEQTKVLLAALFLKDVYKRQEVEIQLPLVSPVAFLQGIWSHGAPSSLYLI